jgi:hypothetical protein
MAHQYFPYYPPHCPFSELQRAPSMFQNLSTSSPLTHLRSENSLTPRNIGADWMMQTFEDGCSDATPLWTRYGYVFPTRFAPPPPPTHTHTHPTAPAESIRHSNPSTESVLRIQIAPKTLTNILSLRLLQRHRGSNRRMHRHRQSGHLLRGNRPRWRYHAVLSCTLQCCLLTKCRAVDLEGQ